MKNTSDVLKKKNFYQTLRSKDYNHRNKIYTKIHQLNYEENKLRDETEKLSEMQFQSLKL